MPRTATSKGLLIRYHSSGKHYPTFRPVPLYPMFKLVIVRTAGEMLKHCQLEKHSSVIHNPTFGFKHNVVSQQRNR